MPRLNLRLRLLLGFVGTYLVLTALIGLLTWVMLAHQLKTQAKSSAENVGRVIAQGGFSLNPAVMSKMQQLTGYRFASVRPEDPQEPGTVRVEKDGVLIEVFYQNNEFHATRLAVVMVTGLTGLLGALIFATIAWILAGRIARPVHQLTAAARAIGEGHLDHPVQVDGGPAEIQHLASDLDAMRSHLAELLRRTSQAERLATLGTFTATIAHEVRNPLSAVRLTVQLLQRKNPTDAGLVMITEELERLDLIVDELLSFSRGMDVQKVDCDLHAVASDVTRLLRRQAEHAEVTLHVDGQAHVHADPARMRQLLLNLILNAIQACRGGGAVTVHVQPDGLRVDDNGPGVNPALVPHLFEAFRSDKPGGTGLGLHLATSIATAHQATLGYAPRAGGGASFTLCGLQPAR